MPFYVQDKELLRMNKYPKKGYTAFVWVFLFLFHFFIIIIFFGRNKWMVPVDPIKCVIQINVLNLKTNFFAKNETQTKA